MSVQPKARPVSICVVAQPAIKSVANLRGKRVGSKLGTVNHLILLEALKLHQIKPEEVKI